MAENLPSKQTREVNSFLMTELTPEFVKQAKLKRRELLAKESGRIRNQYGVTDERTALQILSVERELAACQRCKGYPCPKAYRRGKVPMLDGERITVTTCKIYQRKEFYEACRSANIPSRYVNLTFKAYKADGDNSAAMKFAENVLAKKYSGAYFYGAAGTGKTFLASLIAKEFIKAGKSVCFVKVADLLNEFYEIYRGQSTESEQTLLNRLYSVDLLVLDDFGLERSKQFVGSLLCKIIDARYNQPDLTTIITSNRTIKEAEAELNNALDGETYNGTRIYDRCAQFCKTIHFKGESRRK